MINRQSTGCSKKIRTGSWLVMSDRLFILPSRFSAILRQLFSIFLPYGNLMHRGTFCPSPNGFMERRSVCFQDMQVFQTSWRYLSVWCESGIWYRFQTTCLAAQIIWFFLEGFSQKQYETPSLNESNSGQIYPISCQSYRLEDDLIFIKSNLTDRWWIEINAEQDEMQYIAVSHEDYLKANVNECTWQVG